MPFEIDWRPGAIEDVRQLFDYLAEHASLQDARHVTDRLLSSTDKLTKFPRLYQEPPEYGDSVRRISLMGQNILYEVDDAAKVVRVLAVVGGRQQHRKVR
ncbi:MAG: type II toxin-antitoxin system RelE/ParE family toxin [Lautropia sp.]|nr:MAG: type II toxin-antitoxin system RelE/ParE family toxin [Lautropia sp.]